jgi:hypothetical protein
LALGADVIKHFTTVIYCHILALEKEDTTVNYSGIFKTSAPETNVIKLLALKFTNVRNELVLVPKKTFQLSLMFASKARANSRLQTLPKSIRLG